MPGHCWNSSHALLGHKSFANFREPGYAIMDSVAKLQENIEQDGIPDLDVWFAEGLVDTVVLQHRPPPNPVGRDSRDIIESAHRHGIRVVHLLGGHLGVDFASGDLSAIHPVLANWRQWGSDGFGFYEAERIARDSRWLSGMPEIVSEWARGVPLSGGGAGRPCGSGSRRLRG